MPTMQLQTAAQYLQNPAQAGANALNAINIGANVAQSQNALNFRREELQQQNALAQEQLGLDREKWMAEQERLRMSLSPSQTTAVQKLYQDALANVDPSSQESIIQGLEQNGPALLQSLQQILPDKPEYVQNAATQLMGMYAQAQDPNQWQNTASYLDLLKRSGQKAGDYEIMAGTDASTGQPAMYRVNKVANTAEKIPGMLPKPGSKQKITVNPDGTVTFEQGAGVEGAELQKPTLKMIEEKLINSQEGLTRVNSMIDQFDPAFQEVPSRLGAEWTSFKTKMGWQTSAEENAFLDRYAMFRQDAFENINRTIKDFTGAQMSEAEAKRLRKMQPDPGDGPFSGDDARTFRAKMINVRRKLIQARARYAWYKKKGLDDMAIYDKVYVKESAVPLSRMEEIMSQRAKEIRKKNQGISTAEVQVQIADEFGL